ncbi:mismatch-specific DNA-glycosylase [Paeniroseomonas aquatica]|uniref:Mismatch-specific DNA-glycosylase n=1 Tax=Paeniroseomonas aquatica TaxID=373043 RepID=A0ABT8A3C5_9PROT|nr:mismatch-specific DNA-glycosylase [Paeniroseomonas aquatica]MDN3564215.1 mismatch-specific DNA-glycosylase [Paeniroseomonas aquatica]
MTPALPDLLRPGLRLVFCGTAASHESRRIGAYYAGRGNRFWPVLQAAGFTRCLVRPAEYRRLARAGIGLTDLCKTASGMDRDLRPADFDTPGFVARMARWRPAAIAFTSQEAAAAALGLAKRALAFGAQPEGLVAAAAPGLAFARLFVLPSPSGANGHWAALRHHWADCARSLGFAAPAMAA